MQTLRKELEEYRSFGRIFALIPAYNEEKNILKTVKDLEDCVDLIIVIDDGSTDKTQEELSKYKGSKLVNIKLNENKGKGNAVVNGLRWINENYKESNQKLAVVFIDGDGQMDIDYLLHMVDPIFNSNQNFVKASRFKYKSDNDTMPPFRKFGNSILRILNWVATGQWNITDPQNGYFAISHEAIQNLDLDEIDTGYFFENSILFNTGKRGENIAEVRVPSIYGVGEVSTLKYHTFIPKTTIKLLMGWYKRQHETRHKSILRKYSYYFLILFSISLIFTVLSIMIPSVDWWFGYETIWVITSGILLTISIFLDYIDFKKRYDKSE